MFVGENMNDYIARFFNKHKELKNNLSMNKERIITNPNVNDPLEMKFRETIYNINVDLTNITNELDWIAPLEFEEDYVVDYYSKLIEILRTTHSEEKVAKKMVAYGDPIKEAIREYQSIFFDNDTFLEICNSLGYDYDDEYDRIEYIYYWKIVEKISNEVEREVNSPEDIMYEIERNEYFHELCEETMKVNAINSYDKVYKIEKIIS